jgi:hypothetical protein
MPLSRASRALSDDSPCSSFKRNPSVVDQSMTRALRVDMDSNATTGIDEVAERFTLGERQT